MKAALKDAERELAAAEAARDAAPVLVPTRPMHPRRTAPTGNDAEELRRVAERPQLPTRASTEIGRFGLERAARIELPGSDSSQATRSASP